VIALALLLQVSIAPAPVPVPVWRVVDRPGLHVGVRPFALATNDGPEVALGVTAQVTAFFLQR
jgi:hypothetical protein